MKPRLPVQAILNRYRRGECYPSIAADFGVEPAVIRCLVHHTHVLRRYTTVRTFIRNHHLVRDYLEKHLSQKKLAAKYRLSITTVSRMLGSAGCKKQPSYLRRERALRLAFLSQSLGHGQAAKEVGITTKVAARHLAAANLHRNRPRRVNRALLVAIVRLRQENVQWRLIDQKLKLGKGVSRSYFYRYREALPNLLVLAKTRANL